MEKRDTIRVLEYLLLFVLAFNIDAKAIEFAGREWTVKSGYGGPGPNYWSDSEQSVWVDGNGWLHLKIREEGGTWYCSEVYTKAPTQYGMHRFYVITRLDSLDMNVVAALFLYKDDQTEVDIEFAKWGSPNPGYNAQYVVQPWNNPGNLERFLMELSGTYTTHYIDWHFSLIQFKSIHGHYEEPPDPNYLIHQWQYTGSDIPPESENLRIHINLWLYQGNPPSNGEEVEIIIKDVDLPPPRLPNLRPYTPSGWQQPVIVSNIPGTHTLSDSLWSSPDTSYTDWSIINDGNDTAYNVKVRLYLDYPNDYDDYYLSGDTLAPWWYAYWWDWIYYFPTGEHIVGIMVDPDDVVQESNENDNLFLDTLYWYPHSGTRETTDDSVYTFELQLLQNPVHGRYINMELLILYKSSIKFNLFNVAGQRVRTFREESFSSGYHIIKLSVDGLASGIYFLSMDSGSWSKLMKVLIVR